MREDHSYIKLAIYYKLVQNNKLYSVYRLKSGEALLVALEIEPLALDFTLEISLVGGDVLEVLVHLPDLGVEQLQRGLHAALHFAHVELAPDHRLPRLAQLHLAAEQLVQSGA